MDSGKHFMHYITCSDFKKILDEVADIRHPLYKDLTKYALVNMTERQVIGLACDIIEKDPHLSIMDIDYVLSRICKRLHVLVERECVEQIKYFY